MYLINILDSDIIFYILIALLICIVFAMFYLIYSQNKELSMEMKRRRELQKVKTTDEFEDTFVSDDKLDLDKLREEQKDLDDVVPQLIEPTSMTIPDKLEYTQSIYLSDDMVDLQSITKELETLPKERKVKLTPYEEEQEEKAIISYDELLSKTGNVRIDYSDTDYNFDEEQLIKQVETEKINKTDVMLSTNDEDNKVEVISYEHEEAFLKALKQLQELLN